MMNLLKNRSKRSRKDAAPRDKVSVDISRVIPGFSGEEQVAAQTPAAAVDQTGGTEPAAKAPVSLEEKHTIWLRRDMERLINGWTAVQDDIESKTCFQRLHLATHDLKGMATTYGYPAISRLAHSLDKLLKSRNWHRNTALINLHIEACKAAAGNGPTGDRALDAVSEEVCRALEEQVSKLTSNKAIAS